MHAYHGHRLERAARQPARRAAAGDRSLATLAAARFAGRETLALVRGGAAAATRAAVLGGLQRSAGNAAVARLLGGRRHHDRAATPVEAAAVQRCGGETHDGCPCADQGADQGAVRRQAAGGGAVQRQPTGLCAPPSPLVGTPFCEPPKPVVKPPLALPPAPARYAALDKSLVELVEFSRLRALSSPGQRFLDNAFGDGKVPATWIEALDNFDDAGVNVLAQNNELAREVPGLWDFLLAIKDTFWSTSQGFHFEAHPGLRGFLETSAKMCNDFVITERIFHGGASCFRQMGKNNVPGIHVCLQDDTHGDIHVDKHQVTTGAKLPTGMCVFSPGALVEHKRDLEGRAKFGAWHRHSGLKREVDDVRAKLPGCGPAAFLFQPEADALKRELDAIDSRTLASRGVKGERELHTKLNPLQRRVRKLQESTQMLCGGGGKLSCLPPGLLPGGGTAAAVAPAAPAGGATLQTQAAGAGGSDLVGLTRGDGITVGTFDRRPRVERLQRALNERGAALDADGMFGGQTATALRQFQARNGTPEQDTVDPASAEALEAGGASGAEISRLEGLKHQDGITFGTWHLRPRVSELQGRLTGNGFPCTVDGMFGDKTLAALNAFQGVRQLPAGTEVDRATADALEGRDGPAPDQCPAGQVPIPEFALA